MHHKDMSPSLLLGDHNKPEYDISVLIVTTIRAGTEESTHLQSPDGAFTSLSHKVREWIED